MSRNPENFPCEFDPGTYVELDECETCERKERCDIYVTMLTETENE